ncbi:contractile injection system protein, VgrG/Pvc8 family [Enterocloster clostridioformis]|nr:contractile injection system protein, VgrG/Pvc8 family [uncultured Anaerostipes sp.]
MKIKLAGYLSLDTELPLLGCDYFQFVWKSGCHALLELEGYISRNTNYSLEKIVNSKVKILLDEKGKDQILFHGYIINFNKIIVGDTERVVLNVLSASYKLDCQATSRSYQDMEKTYGEIVRLAVQKEGGLVIRNKKTDRKISSPVIQYEETAWEFAKRLAFELGICIFPDIETGEPNLWFGMRNGKNVLPFSEVNYLVQICHHGNEEAAVISFRIESIVNYKIGDYMEYAGQEVVITEKEARYEKGELVFKYLLENKALRRAKYSSYLAGLGLWGAVKEIKNESVSVALDIDQGQDTGSYFYPWYSDTGNVLYAMPEVGAKVLLYFNCAAGNNGAVIHCLNKEREEQERDYKSRNMNLKEGNSVSLFENDISFSRAKHDVRVSDNSVLLCTSKKLKITAEGKIKFEASNIKLSMPDELNICQV